MSGIDNRVVAMKFDNASFESNMATTMSSLDKLKASLRFDGASKGMADIQSAAGGFNMNPLVTSVESVSASFLALSTVAITALSNIVSRAVDAGVSITKSLSIDQVNSGFQEYELKMGSIQTILANTAKYGTTLPEVNASLEELNKYADKTIYNFGDMTKNIGLFTNAGIRVEDATSMIKGFSNAAAASGTSSEGAAGAAYQLSQAMSAGTIRLMDWKSLTNVGMGNKNMQQSIVDVAQAMGAFKDTGTDAAAAAKDFNASLENKWLSSDVMGKYLKIMAGEVNPAQMKSLGLTQEQIDRMVKEAKTAEEAATKVRTFTGLVGTLKESVGSGWAESFGIVLGDFDKATSLFTGLSGYFGGIAAKSTQARNELLVGWEWLGGRDVMIHGLMAALYALEQIIKPIKDAFREIFPAKNAFDLLHLTERVRDFFIAITPGPETISILTRIFRGLFAAVEIGWTIFKEFGKVVIDLFSGLSGAGGGALNFFASLGDKISNLNKSLVEGKGITSFFESIQSKLSKFADKLDLGPKIDKIADAFRYLKNVLSDIFIGDSEDGGSHLQNTLGGITEKLKPLEKISAKVADVWERLGKVATKIADKVSEVGAKVREAATEMFAGLKGAFDGEGVDKTIDIVNVGLFAGLLLSFRKFTKVLEDGLQFEWLGDVIGSIQNTFESLTGVLKSMQADLRAKTLLKIAAAIAILTISLVVLASIDSDALTRALLATAIGMGQLVGAMALLAKVDVGPKFTFLVAGLLLFAGAMVILGLAVKGMASLSWAELARGLGGIMAMIGIMVVAAKLLEDSTWGMIKASLGIKYMAKALVILGLAVKIFGEMDYDKLKQGLIAVAAIMGILIVSMRLLPDDMSKKTSGMFSLALSLGILAGVVYLFGSLDLKTLAQGLLGIGGVITILALTLALMPKPKDLKGISLSLIGMGIALGIMALSVLMLGSLSWDELLRGLVGIAGVLLVLAIATNAMKGAASGAVAIAIVVASLYLLAGVLVILAQLSWEQIGKGLLAIVVTLAAFGLIGYILSPIVPALLGLALALVMVSGSFIAFGIAAVLFAKAFEIVANNGKAGVDMVMGFLDTIIKKLPELFIALANGIIDAALTFFERAPEFVEGVVKFGVSIIDGLIELIPKIAEAVGELISALLTLLVEKTPELIAAGWKLLLDFLKGIRDNVGELVGVVADIILNFINAMNEEGNIKQIFDAGTNLLINFLSAISSNIDDVVASVAQLIINFLKAVTAKLPDIITAGANLVIEFIKGIGKNATRIVDAGVETVIKFIEGLGKNAVKLADAAFVIVTDFLNGLADVINRRASELRSAGVNLITAVLDGVTGGLATKTKNLANELLKPFKEAWDKVTGFFEINSPSKRAMRLAYSVTEGFGLGMDKSTVKVVTKTEAFGSAVVGSLNKTFSNISIGLESMGEFKPIITPVLDLSSVRKDANSLGSILGAQELSAQVSYAQASSLVTSVNDSVATQAATSTSSGPTEISFTQINQSPEALSVSQIYRNTNNQIALAKETLGVT